MAFNNIPPNGFPALPDVEDLEAVEKDVASLKSSVLGLTQDVTDLNAQKANQITIAPFFNSESSYDVGDLVYYNGLSYRCTNAHEGAWDADDFASTTIANELDTLKSGLTFIIIQSKAQFEELCFNADSQTKAIWFMTVSTFSIFPITNGSGIILPCLDLTWRKVIYHGSGNTLFIGEINKSNNVLTYTWKQVTTTSV